LQGEPAGVISKIVERFEGRLLRYARTLLGADGSAEDIVQETFVRLLEEATSVRKLGPWLYRVTHNGAVDLLRKEARLRGLHERADRARAKSESPLCEDGLTREDHAKILVRELGRLSGNERAVIVLKVVEGMSYREIRAVTGLSTSNVGYLIHHGLKKLARQLADAGALKGGLK